jgi:RHS repeat-associated protein
VKPTNGQAVLESNAAGATYASPVTEVSDFDSEYAYLYDNLNRQTSANYLIEKLNPTIDVVRGYDAASRTTSVKTSIGGTLDSLNQYGYDNLDNVTQITQAAQTGGYAVSPKRVDFAYNANSQLTGALRYASTTTASPVASSSYGYDEAGRLTSIGHAGTASGSTFAETHSYVYDAASRITSYGNVLLGDGGEFTYDNLGQLTAEDREMGLFDREYAYDAGGNRTSDSFKSYEVAPYNRLQSDDDYAYTYDNEGNLSTRTETATGDYTVYTWDHRNRLTKVQDYNASSVLQQTVDKYYDALNQLIRQVVTVGSSSKKTAFVYDGGQVVLQFDKSTAGSNMSASTLTHRYLWAAAVDALLADQQVTSLSNQGATYWTLADDQGSVRDVVDSSGVLRIHRAFDSFGNANTDFHYNSSGSAVTSGQTGYIDEAFAFTGRWFDKATGLQNNLNRWYDPAIGRWLSEDPIGFEGGDANLYRYVGNSPTNWIDPSGLWWFTWDDYKHYFWHPEEMDTDLRVCNKFAMGAIGVGGGGLAGVGAGAIVGGGAIGGIVGGGVGGGVGGAIGRSRDGGALGGAIGGIGGGIAGNIGGAGACPWVSSPRLDPNLPTPEEIARRALDPNAPHTIPGTFPKSYLPYPYNLTGYPGYGDFPPWYKDPWWYHHYPVPWFPN